MAGAGEFPKSDGDILHPEDVNFLRKHADFTSHSTSNSDWTTLASYTLPANTFKHRLWVIVKNANSGACTTDGGVGLTRLKIGGTVIWECGSGGCDDPDRNYWYVLRHKDDVDLTTDTAIVVEGKDTTGATKSAPAEITEFQVWGL